MTGEFQALDAETGKILWSFQTPSGIIGQPITWERNGKQYVTVMSGIGGVYALRSGDPNLVNVPAGASHVDLRPVRQVTATARGSPSPAGEAPAFPSPPVINGGAPKHRLKWVGVFRTQ